MSGGSTNTVTRTELDPSQAPYVQYGLSEAQRLYATGGPQAYTGQTYVGPSQQTQAALSAMQTRAMQGNPLVPLAQQQLASQIGGGQAATLQGQFNPVLQNTLSGSFLGPNPYLTQALQPGFTQASQAYQDAINQMRSKASASGRYGTNEALMSQEARAQGALANALTSQAGQLAYQNYGDERARQMSALGLGANLYEQERARQQAAIGAAPGMAAQDYTDIAQLAQVGQTAEQYQQAALADAIQKFNYQQQQPYSNLQSFLSSAYGAPMGQQTIQPTYSNPLAGALGGALTGAKLGSMVPGLGTGLGAAAGGLLGLLGR
jgi:hypothetical protein